MTARERFRQSKELVTGFNDIIDSNRMQAAFDAALITFTDSLPTAADAQTAAGNAYKLEGARKLLDILKNLNTENSTKTTGQPRLNHQV